MKALADIFKMLMTEVPRSVYFNDFVLNISEITVNIS